MNHVLDDYIFNNYVVIGVSAGPDSMCLLDLLQKKTTKIVVCHINHNVRKESIEEEEYITKYCQDKNIILEKTTINNYQENNFENEARKKRYMFYEEILKKYNSKTLLLAHHGDDLIETILMKISRGSNLEGYAGIKEISNVKNYQIIRPLLKYTKEDIINYNKSNNIKYYNDSSNQSTNYTRNRYRLNILPLLKKEDKNIHKKYLKYSKTLIEYDDYIKREVKRNINNVYKDNIINIDNLNKLDTFLIKNILYNIMNNIYQNKNNIITDRHIQNIISLLNNTKPNIKIDLPPFTLVGATTRAGDLSAPLRDRFGIISKLQYYTVEELTQIIKRTAKVLGVGIEDDAAVELASRSRGTPRIANRLFKRVRDFALVKGDGNIDKDIINIALDRLKVDNMGLDETDHELLLAIIKKFNGGPVGVEAVASAIGEEVTTIEDVYEPYLLQTGLLKRTSRGRVATPKAYEVLHLNYEDFRKK